MSRTSTTLGQKRVETLRIEPPRAFVSLLQAMNAKPSRMLFTLPDTDSEDTKTEPSDTEPSETEAISADKPFADIQSDVTGETHHFFGRALHHGSLAFLHHANVVLTVSPCLLAALGILSVFSAIRFESISISFSYIGLVILLYAAQVLGHIVAGRFARSEAESLVISLLGVTDPGLIIRERPIFHVPEIFETSDGVYLHGDSPEILQESARQLRQQVEESRSKGSSPSETLIATSEEFAREFSVILRAPIRVIGASLMSLLCVGFLHYSALPQHFAEDFLLTQILWFIAAMLVVAPFLPPHRIGGVLPFGIRAFIFPIGVFCTLFVMLPTASQIMIFEDLPPFSILLIFGLLIVARKLWWTHLTTLSKLSQQTPISNAAIPIENLVVFHHGETISSAQRKCVHTDQEYFPVLSQNQLKGMISRKDLMRTQHAYTSSESLATLLDDTLSLVDSHMSLEAFFSPKLCAPFFAVEDGAIAGMVTPRSARDALFLSLQDQIQDQHGEFEE